MRLSEVIVLASLFLFLGWSFTTLFSELATVRPNVEKIILNK